MNCLTCYSCWAQRLAHEILPSLLLPLLSTEPAQRLLLLLELLLSLFLAFLVIVIDDNVNFGVVFGCSIRLASGGVLLL